MEPLYYISTILITGLTLFLYANWCFSYWKKKNIVSFQPTFPFGNLKNPIVSKESQGVQMKSFYDRLKSIGAKYGGYYLFLSPVFVPADPDCIKSVLSSDFEYFQARGFYNNEKDQPLSANLFSVDGPRWRALRVKFTPTFTSSKMKQMFLLMLDCSDAFKNSIDTEIAAKKPINMKHVANCYTLDSISSCAFGLELTSFKKADDEFYTYAKRGINEVTSLIKGGFCFSFPTLARMLKLVSVSRDIENFMSKVVRDVVSHREENNIRRNDFLQILIDLKNDQQKTKQESLSLDDITAQSFLFLLAGFDTSANTITYCTFELAQNKAIQQKARTDVENIMSKHGGQITYEALQEMKYLQKLIDETLRKYPIVAILHRQCTNDYKISGSDVIIEKGTNVLVPVLGLHRDPEFYPEPEKFDPERFSNDNVRARHSHAYIPFGEGPRNCIGLRFGLLQVKVALAVILSNFDLTLNPNTILPLQFDSTFVLHTVNDILVDMEVIKK